MAAEPVAVAEVEMEPSAEVPIEPVAQPVAPAFAPPPKPVGLRDRLARTSEVLVGRLEAILGGRKVDPGLLDELEALLFTADLGVQTAESLLQAVRAEAAGEDEGYLVHTTYDASTDTSSVDIRDATDLAAPPVARVLLPVRIPRGFHGNWIRAHELSSAAADGRVR